MIHCLHHLTLSEGLLRCNCYLKWYWSFPKLPIGTAAYPEAGGILTSIAQKYNSAKELSTLTTPLLPSLLTLSAENCSAMIPATKEAGEDSVRAQVPNHLRPLHQSKNQQDDKERDSCGLQKGNVAPRTVSFPGDHSFLSS